VSALSLLYNIGNTNIDTIRVFGSNLKKYRTTLGLSQKHLPKNVDYTELISAIECYQRSIALENIQRIADALMIEPYKLLIEEKDDVQH